MLKKLLALDPSQEVDGIDLAFRGGLVFALVLIAISIAFAVYLYRSERHLPKGRRMVMMICQVTALLGSYIGNVAYANSTAVQNLASNNGCVTCDGGTTVAGNGH